MSVTYSEKLHKYIDTDYEDLEELEAEEEPVEEIPMFRGTLDKLNNL